MPVWIVGIVASMQQKNVNVKLCYEVKFKQLIFVIIIVILLLIYREALRNIALLL